MGARQVKCLVGQKILKLGVHNRADPVIDHGHTFGADIIGAHGVFLGQKHRVRQADIADPGHRNCLGHMCHPVPPIKSRYSWPMGAVAV